MNILLDESLPVQLISELRGYKVRTVTQEKWTGKKNGELLKLAESKFDVFITGDQNLQYQVNIIRHSILIIVLKAKTNRLEDLRPLVPQILSALNHSKKGIIQIS